MKTKKKTNSKKTQKNIRTDELNQMIEKKAYELYEKRGSVHGNDVEDWAEAERIVKRNLSY